MAEATTEEKVETEEVETKESPFDLEEAFGEEVPETSSPEAEALAKRKEEVEEPEEEDTEEDTEGEEKPETEESEAEPSASRKESPEKEPDKEADAEAEKAEDEPPEKSSAEVELESKLTTAEKRRVDTLKWANDLSQQVSELRRQNAVLENKLKDPDYDPANDPDVARAQAQEAQTWKEAEIRAELSLQAARDKYAKEEGKGPEYVDQKLAEFRQKFGGDRATQDRILSSDMPVQAAIDTVNLANFLEEYGSDTDKILSTIEDRLTKKLTPKIREEEKKKLLSSIKKADKAGSGLRKARSSEETPKGEKKTEALEELFG